MKIRKLFKTEKLAFDAVMETGEDFYSSSADDRSNLDVEYIDEDDEWNGICWSGEVPCYRTMNGDIFAWWN